MSIIYKKEKKKAEWEDQEFAVRWEQMFQDKINSRDGFLEDWLEDGEEVSLVDSGEEHSRQRDGWERAKEWQRGEKIWPIIQGQARRRNNRCCWGFKCEGGGWNAVQKLQIPLISRGGYMTFKTSAFKKPPLIFGKQIS